MKCKTVSWFSSGVSSAVATKMALDKYPDLEIVYIDIDDQHPDSMRFVKDCEKWFNREIIVLKHELASVDNVCRKYKYVNGPGGARCTMMLKKQVRQMYEQQNIVKTYIWGMDYSKREIARADRIRETMPLFEHEFPLIEQEIDKKKAHSILDQAGIKRPVMYDLGYPNNNCLAGTEKIITSQGARQLKDIANIPTEILTSKGFEISTVKDYGMQNCYEVEIERSGLTYKIIASYNHRWFVRPRSYRDETCVVPTFALQPGFAIPTGYLGTHQELDIEGIRHGIVYGDGTLYSEEKSSVRLCGDKFGDLIKYFPEFKGKKDVISGLNPKYKTFPDVASESKNYLAGFLAGYLATDGCFLDGITISSAKPLYDLKQLCECLGVGVHPITKIEGDTNFKKDRTLYTMRIISASLPPVYDIREQRKWRGHRADDGRVVSIKGIGNRRVYCPTTSTSDIILEYNILTGQCLGCVKAGAGYWNKIRIDFPDVFASRAKMERDIGASCIKGVYLDELDPSKGRDQKVIEIEDCGILCDIKTYLS